MHEFPIKRALKQHMKEKHSSDAQSYSCQICEEEFSEHKQLKIHEKTHVIPECENCKMKFVNMKDLKSHLIQEHKSLPSTWTEAV